ncbi:hypothetical protein ACFL1G_05415 [Planctomycetota bacterium]
MKGYILISLLIGVVFSTVAFAQETLDEPQEDLEYQMDMRQRELELQQQEMELDFQRQRQQLELEKWRIGLEQGERKLQRLGHSKEHDEGGKIAFLLVCFVVHILLAVWVYKDIRTRNSSSGIWIAVVLLTGLLGMIPYAIVRLGDIRVAK